jgi:hypothetical protein
VIKGLTASPREMQSAMGLPSVTSAVFLIANLVNRRHRGGITEMPLPPLRGFSVSGMYGCDTWKAPRLNNRHVHAHKCLYCAGIEPAASNINSEDVFYPLGIKDTHLQSSI